MLTWAKIHVCATGVWALSGQVIKFRFQLIRSYALAGVARRHRQSGRGLPVERPDHWRGDPTALSSCFFPRRWLASSGVRLNACLCAAHDAFCVLEHVHENPNRSLRFSPFEAPASERVRADEEGDKGYVLFAKHDDAKQCVETGAGAARPGQGTRLNETGGESVLGGCIAYWDSCTALQKGA